MEYIKLGKIATVEISGVDKKTTEGEQEVRLCNFVDVYHNWAITSELRDSFMSATAKVSEIDKFKLRKGQVAITKDSETRDDIGIPTYIADTFDDVILGYHCALITPNEEKLTGKYLNALLHSDYAKKYFECNASGSGQRYTLSIDTLNDFPVPMRTIEEQKRIGHILSSIDKKICLNKAINHNLEEQARQLYEYWFLQFDFPNSEGEPYRSSGGEMKYCTELKRYIPVHWNVLKLFDAVNVLYGFPMSTELFTDDSSYLPIVRIRDILDGTTSAYSKEKINDKYRLEKGDVVVGMDGNFHMNYWHNNTDYLIQRCVRLRMTKDNNISAIQTLLSIEPYIKAKENNAKGSTVGHLSDKDMKSLYILEPVNNSHFKPKELFNSILQIILENRGEIIELTRNKQMLLPLLISSQVDISSLNYDLYASLKQNVYL